MDIGSNASYPSKALSNFSGHRFEMDGVQCNSMEGFLQSLKFDKQPIQEEVCKLVGYGAKRRGASKDWKTKQTLYWKGVSYKRDSVDYQKLLDKAYMRMYHDSEAFRKALHLTAGTLTHNIGKYKINETVLTVREFCGRLERLRDNKGKL